jgi:hypothetical protein
MMRGSLFWCGWCPLLAPGVHPLLISAAMAVVALDAPQGAGSSEECITAIHARVLSVSLPRLVGRLSATDLEQNGSLVRMQAEVRAPNLSPSLLPPCLELESAGRAELRRATSGELGRALRAGLRPQTVP